MMRQEEGSHILPRYCDRSLKCVRCPLLIFAGTLAFVASGLMEHPAELEYLLQTVMLHVLPGSQCRLQRISSRPTLQLARLRSSFLLLARKSWQERPSSQRAWRSSIVSAIELKDSWNVDPVGGGLFSGAPVGDRRSFLPLSRQVFTSEPDTGSYVEHLQEVGEEEADANNLPTV